MCYTKENTALYLLEEWNYEPQLRSRFLRLVPKLGRLETRIAVFKRRKSVLLTSRFNFNKPTGIADTVKSFRSYVRS